MVLPRFHPRPVLLSMLSAGALAVVYSSGCDKQPEAQTADEPRDASTPDDEATEQAQAKVDPPPRDEPPAVEGAVFDQHRYVQTCANPDGCPDMLQEAAAAHCSALELAGRSWRLPEKAEATRFDSLAIEQTAGYHWTKTEYAEDSAQIWIVDPASNQPTTVPKDRKPFRVRCVSDRDPAAGQEHSE